VPDRRGFGRGDGNRARRSGPGGTAARHPRRSRRDLASFGQTLAWESEGGAHWRARDIVKIFGGRTEPAGGPLRLHIGAGQRHLDGWINIDNQKLPGVDRVLDVRRGLPFSNVQSIFAEHFLEHLSLDDGLAFLRKCRSVLRPDGILRLSTPNLTWVVASHFRGDGVDPEGAFADCVGLNKAFHAWGHRFLYNRGSLALVLRSAGFSEVGFRAYGESPHPELRNLEGHERSGDSPEMPHVLVAEAEGRVDPPPALPQILVTELERDLRSR
jgi:predicted SAM-dependent methyltransferase